MVGSSDRFVMWNNSGDGPWHDPPCGPRIDSPFVV